MTRQETITTQIIEAGKLMHRQFKGFDDTNHTMQAEHMPNHLAWTLGHLSRTMNGVAKKLGCTADTSGEFVDGAKGDGRRYAMDLLGFGSMPVDDAELYPPLTRCVEIFDICVARLASAVEKAPDATLDTPTKFAGREVPLWHVASFMLTHNGNHAGQITDLRRALGLGTIFG